MPNDRLGERLVVSPDGRETEAGRKSVTSILFTGSFEEIRQEVVDPFLEDVVPTHERPDIYADLIAGEASLGDLAYESDDVTGLNLTGTDVADAIAFIDAVTRTRFPAYDVFNRIHDPEHKLQRGQVVGRQAQGLLAFYSAAADIASAVNDKYRNSAQIDS